MPSRLDTSFFFLFYLLSLYYLCISAQDSTPEERDALMDLFQATNGASWKNNTNWNVGDPCLNNWFGVQCVQKRIAFLTLSRNNLDGTIPASISDLKDLYYIDVSKNHLQGSIPPEIGTLTNLMNLNFNRNIQISGTLPDVFSGLSKLQSLDFSWNNISGTLPASLGYCKALKLLNGSENRLSGNIPPMIGDITLLEELNLADNYLSGTLPAEICYLQHITSLILSHNLIHGEIPTQINNMTSLVDLDLSYNQLSGEIPETLYTISWIQSILLSGNSLQGEISESIGNTYTVRQIDLSLNSLSGSIPDLSKLKRLEYLDLSTCGLSGSLPELGELTNLKFVDISANHLYGTLPDSIPRLMLLTDFDVSSNTLGGTIPPWISNVSFSMYLINNPFLCPYPLYIPPNVQVNHDCVSGDWYQGVFFTVLCVLELVGFIMTSIVVTLVIMYGLRPALLTMLTNNNDGKELDVDMLHRRSRHLGKAKIAVFSCCLLEIVVSMLMCVVGVAMYLKSSSLYRPALIFSVPITGLAFLIKSVAIIIVVKRNRKRSSLSLTFFQLLQLIFIPWSFTLEGVSIQANELSCCVLCLVFLDTATDVMAALCAYLMEDQFIPVRHLQLDDKLKDAEGVFGEVRHGKYFGMDIAVKRAKPETKNERKLIYQAFLREAKILGDLGDHPNIVKLVGISPTLKDEFYIVMDYCDNRDALSYLRKVHREEDTKTWIRCVLKLCVGVCDAMRYVHSKGYTHRDITACNILVKGERAMLADLGLARKQNSKFVDELDCMPQNHSLYAPPEIRVSPDKYTKGCDVYCFGIALWEMLMLRRWTREDLSRGIAVLEDLNEFPLCFKNIISQCWHEDDSFRPSFDELLSEFTAIYSLEWSTYREVVCEPRNSAAIEPAIVRSKRNVAVERLDYRVQSFSTVDIAENISYCAKPVALRGDSPLHSIDSANSSFEQYSINLDPNITEYSLKNFSSC